MSDSIYSFHPTIQKAYLKTLQWLHQRGIGYRSLDYEDLKKNLYSFTPESTAAQFHSYTPGHAFKVQHIINGLIEKDRLYKLFIPNTPIVLIDIGCGCGAASIGLMNALLNDAIRSRLASNLRIFLLGIDPDKEALKIYKTFFSELQKCLNDLNSGISIECKTIAKGLPYPNHDIKKRMEQLLTSSDKLYIPQVIGIQSNILPVLNKIIQDESKETEELLREGFSEASELANQYGESCASLYRELIESDLIDEITAITVGTDSGTNFEHDVRAIGQEINRAFSAKLSKGSVKILDWTDSNRFTVKYYNPIGSRFDQNKAPYTNGKTHFVDIKNISQTDSVWHELISIDNLRLAWARSRRALLRESLADDIEIRLFEHKENLENNLVLLRGHVQPPDYVPGRMREAE